MIDIKKIVDEKMRLQRIIIADITHELLEHDSKIDFQTEDDDITLPNISIEDYFTDETLEYNVESIYLKDGNVMLKLRNLDKEISLRYIGINQMINLVYYINDAINK